MSVYRSSITSDMIDLRSIMSGLYLSQTTSTELLIVTNSLFPLGQQPQVVHIFLVVVPPSPNKKTE